MTMQQGRLRLEELPDVRWSARVSPSLDRRSQLILYSEQMGHEAAQRQVRLHREALARAKPRKAERS